MAEGKYEEGDGDPAFLRANERQRIEKLRNSIAVNIVSILRNQSFRESLKQLITNIERLDNIDKRLSLLHRPRRRIRG